MSEKGLKYIFEESACLTKRQLSGYVTNRITPEEAYPLEHHIHICPLCREALEGALKQRENLPALSELNPEFLKEHFSITHPEVHLNSMALSSSLHSGSKFKGIKTVRLFLKPSGYISAAVLILCALGYMEISKSFKTGADPEVRARSVIKSPEAENTLEPVAAESFFRTDKAVTTTPGENPVETFSVRQVSGEQPGQQKPEPLLIADPAQKIKKEPQHIAGQKPNVVPAEKNTREETVPKTTGTKEKKEKLIKEQPDQSFENPAAKEVSGTEILSAEELFRAGKFEAALKNYKAHMNTGSDRDRQYAALNVARCYMGMGKYENAKLLLQSLVENGSGAPKRQARRMLRNLE